MAEEVEPSSSSQPLLGVVLCCTSISPEKRSELAVRAEQMGAVHKLDLTSDVTHLVVGDADTPKYKYVAKERPDVKVLSVAWVDAVRQLWMEGGEIDVGALEEEHRLPTFASLRICLTGFDDLSERQQIQALITANGAEYHGDLTKNVTHLLARKTEGEKYKYAKLWGLRTVSLEWLMHSIERGMILEEESYDPLLPVEERGKNAWVRRKSSETSLGKRSREDGPTPGASELELGGRRKLRRTTSNKLGSQNSAIWNDIVGGGFGMTQNDANQWNDSGTRPDACSDPPPLPLSAKPSARSTALATAKPTGKENRRPMLELGEPGHSKDHEKQGLFFGRRFYLQGFDRKKTSILGEHLVSHGAEMISSLEKLEVTPSADAGPSYMIVPHHTPMTAFEDLTGPNGAFTIVTEWWIERCLHRKSLVDPDSDVTSRPFARFPIQGFGGMKICSTAFSGVDLLHVSKLVKLMGASYDEYLSANATVLVCNTSDPNKDKLRHALGWGVTVVTADWLWESLKDGVKKPYAGFLIRGASEDVDGDAVQGALPVETERRPPAPPTEAITATIAALLARKQSGNSAKQSSNPDASAGRKPPARLLGRAASNASAKSTPFSRASSVDSAYATADPRVALDSQGPEPSQKLLYDDPEMQEQRERVLRKMGGKVDGTLAVARPKSIGVAKDVGSVGTRTRQRTHR
ncbi:MAG: hypothetical protein M1832_004240 [Thelocarpon impressellum]|nr:MAG: hypothetical protein M1832_004240 [Thelocarpon impressellum]